MATVSEWFGGRLTGTDRLVLLVLAVLIGLVVVQQLDRAEERGKREIMRSALASFALAQESYFHDHAVYADDVGDFQDRGYEPLPGTTIRVNEATAIGWSATASHRETTAKCFLFVRDAAPIGAATRQGAIRCG
ncbi:MAG: hypothetical protein ACE5PT_00395 [Gemmatimonadales bacterium]